MIHQCLANQKAVNSGGSPRLVLTEGSMGRVRLDRVDFGQSKSRTFS